MDLQAYLDKGMTQAEIARELNISRQAICKQLKKHETPYQATLEQRNTKEFEQLCDLGKRGFTLKQIGIVMNFSERKVHSLCTKHNIRLTDLQEQGFTEYLANQNIKSH